MADISSDDGGSAGASVSRAVAATAHSRRQRAYRERLRERGLLELRLRVPEEEQEAVRGLAQRYIDGDTVMRTAAGLRPRRTGLIRALPWTAGQRRLLVTAVLAAALAGTAAGAIVAQEVDMAAARRAAAELPKLSSQLVAMTAERDRLQLDLANARAEAQRLATDQTAIKAALSSLSSGVGGLRADLLGGGGAAADVPRERQPTPPGPRLVPLTGIAERPAALLPRFEGVETIPETARFALHQFTAGDTLEAVARQYGTSPQEIMSVNEQLRPQPWRFGDRIIVPLAPESERSR